MWHFETTMMYVATWALEETVGNYHSLLLHAEMQGADAETPLDPSFSGHVETCSVDRRLRVSAYLGEKLTSDKKKIELTAFRER